MKTDVDFNSHGDISHPNCEQQPKQSLIKVAASHPYDGLTATSKPVTPAGLQENNHNQNLHVRQVANDVFFKDDRFLTSLSLNDLKLATDSKLERFSDDGIFDLQNTNESFSRIKIASDSKIIPFSAERTYDLLDTKETLNRIKLATDSKLELYEPLDMNVCPNIQPSVSESRSDFSGDLPKARFSYCIANYLTTKTNELFCADSAQMLRRYDNDSGYYKALSHEDFGIYLLNILPDNLVCAVTQNVENEVYRYLLKCRKFSGHIPLMPEKLVNLVNGVFDLDNGKLYPHSASYGFTFGVDAKFIPNKPLSETSERYFLNLGIDEKGKENILAMIGLSICNYRKFQKAVFMYGPGGNGKTICSKFIKRLLPSDMVAGLNFSDLANSFAPSNLENKMVSISTDEDTKKPTSKGISVFKKIVGRDFLEVQKKNIQHHTMESNCFLIFISNYQFKIKKSDDPNGGVKRRIWFIRTGERVSDIDWDLPEKLWDDRDAIVSNALLTASNFLKNWQESMLEPSDEELYEDSNSYGEQLDELISKFVINNLEYKGYQDYQIPMKTLYQNFYKAHSKEVGSLDIRLNGFASRLKKFVTKGTIRKKKNKSTLCCYDWKQQEEDFGSWNEADFSNWDKEV